MPSMGVLSLRMYGAMGQIVICRIVTDCALSVANWFTAVVCHIYRSAWAGFTLLILMKGQCESLNGGIGAERDITPTSFFVSVRL